MSTSSSSSALKTVERFLPEIVGVIVIIFAIWWARNEVKKNEDNPAILPDKSLESYSLAFFVVAAVTWWLQKSLRKKVDVTVMHK